MCAIHIMNQKTTLPNKHVSHMTMSSTKELPHHSVGKDTHFSNINNIILKKKRIFVVMTLYLQYLNKY